jgi:hypothetical protein
VHVARCGGSFGAIAPGSLALGRNDRYMAGKPPWLLSGVVNVEYRTPSCKIR